jgi:hypothetical protein
MVQLWLAVAIPFITAISLGATLGKLSVVGPLLRGVWHTTFWLAVLAQIAAIVTTTWMYFEELNPVVCIAMLAASSASLAMGLMLALIMFPLYRNSAGEDETPSVPDCPSLGGPSLGGIDAAEAALVVVGVGLVVGITFAVSFFPLRGVVRVTSRILHVGVLQA